MAWDIRGKTVLLTGATSGIGLEASVALARQGARVVMVGRNEVKTVAAVADVSARSGSKEVSSLLCELLERSRRLRFEFGPTLLDLIPRQVSRGIDKPRGICVGVEVTVETRRVVDLAEERILAGESTNLGIEVPCLGVEEAQLRIPLVAREGEAVPGSSQLGRESEVAPGVEVVGGNSRAGVVRPGSASRCAPSSSGCRAGAPGRRTLLSR